MQLIRICWKLHLYNTLQLVANEENSATVFHKNNKKKKLKKSKPHTITDQSLISFTNPNNTKISISWTLIFLFSTHMCMCVYICMSKESIDVDIKFGIRRKGLYSTAFTVHSYALMFQTNPSLHKILIFWCDLYIDAFSWFWLQI